NAWFNLSRADMRSTRSLYLALLRKDTPSPFLRESDEEKGGQDKPKADQSGAKKTEAVRIDFAGLNRRLLPFPQPAGDYRRLRAGSAGFVFYLAHPPTTPGQTGPDRAALMRYDVTKRKADTLLSNIS